MATSLLPLKVFLVGRVAEETDGVVIDERSLPGRQGRLLFAYLVAEQGRPVARDELAEALWGEALPATWDKALTVRVSKLRNLLADRGIDGAHALTSAFGCYRLELPEGTWVDFIVAANAARDAEEALAAGDLENAKTAAALAASLVEQPFLPGEEGTWVDEKRSEISDIRGRALSLLADACLRSGETREAVRWAEQTIALAPFRESGYRRLIEAHVAAGDRAEALRVYERCRRLLAEELGTYPSPETETIYRGLLEAPSPPVEAPRGEAPAPAVRVERGSASALRRPLVSRKRVGAGIVLVALTALAVAMFVVRGGRSSHAALVAANSVGFIDARGGHVGRQVSVGQAPTSVGVGDGAVWATNATAGTVSRIDRRTHAVQQTIAVGVSPSGIAVSRDGVWVANHDDDTVSWISPQTNAVVRTIHVGAGPTAVAYGYGSVWVTNAEERTVTRIDADTGDIMKTIRTNAVGSGIAVGGGSVWVTDEATRSVVGIDPTINIVTSKATVGAGPTGIAYGDGSLWVANALDNTVSRVDANTLAEKATIPVPGGPSAVTFSNGMVWVSAEFGSRVVRIDPRRGVVGSTPIGNRPESVAPGSGGVWVAVRASGVGHRGGRLIVLGDSIDSIDPGSVGSTTALLQLGNAYDSLTGFRSVGGAAGTQIVPDLAAALPQPTMGGTSYTFRLRQGIRYSDGRPLRAIDFRRALARELEIDSAPSVPYFTHLAGAAGCIEHGRRHTRCDLSRSVIVNGPLTVTFRLPAPDPRFFWELMGLAPIPAGTPPHDVGTHPVPSTGPYAIENFVPGRLVTFVRNRYFHVWSAAARPDGYPDEIVYRVVKRGNAPAHEVITGKADLLVEGHLSGAQVQQLAARYPRQVHPLPEQATVFVFLNVRRPPFDDVRVRQAVNYAVDRAQVAVLHGAPLAQPTCHLVPPTASGSRPYCPYTVAPDASGDWKAPDLAKARSLVRASGTRGEKIVVWSWSAFRPESQYFVALLRRLGYRARLDYVPGGIGPFFTKLNETPSAQAGFVGWFGTPLAVDMFLQLGCHFGVLNWAHFCDPRIDAQVAQLAREEPVDPAGSAGLAAKIDRELTDRAPWVPLFTPRLLDLTSRRVGNYQVNQGAALLTQLWVRSSRAAVER